MVLPKVNLSCFVASWRQQQPTYRLDNGKFCLLPMATSGDQR